MEGDLGLGKAGASIPGRHVHRSTRPPVAQAGGQLPGRLQESHEAAM